MWPFKKKNIHHKDIYIVEYVVNASISGDVASFNLNEMSNMMVEADDLIEAQQIFAKHHMLTPHVYVHRIYKFDIMWKNVLS